MSWIVWATLGYLMNAVALATDKALLARRSVGNPAVYTLSISALGLLVLLLIPFGFSWPGFAYVWYALGSGLAFTLGLWLLFVVLERGEASRVPAFVGALSPVFVFSAAYFFLGERLVITEVFAFALLCLGGFTMVGGPGGLSMRYKFFAIVAAASFGLAAVCLKLAFLGSTFVTGLILTRLSGFAASLLLLLIPGTWAAFRQGVGHSQGGARFAFIGGQVAGAASGLLNNYAITIASVTLVNALQGVQYVFLLIISLVVSAHFPALFKEQFSGGVAWRKLIGTLAIGFGLWLL